MKSLIEVVKGDISQVLLCSIVFVKEIDELLEFALFIGNDDRFLTNHSAELLDHFLDIVIQLIKFDDLKSLHESLLLLCCFLLIFKWFVLKILIFLKTVQELFFLHEFLVISLKMLVEFFNDGLQLINLVLLGLEDVVDVVGVMCQLADLDLGFSQSAHSEISNWTHWKALPHYLCGVFSHLVRSLLRFIHLGVDFSLLAFDGMVDHDFLYNFDPFRNKMHGLSVDDVVVLGLD